MSFYNNLLTQAHITGTLGGLFAERIMLMIPVSFWQHIGMTVLTTTISFGLPFLYKWLIKKYNEKKIKT